MLFNLPYHHGSLFQDTILSHFLLQELHSLSFDTHSLKAPVSKQESSILLETNKLMSPADSSRTTDESRTYKFIHICHIVQNEDKSDVENFKDDFGPSEGSILSKRGKIQYADQFDNWKQESLNAVESSVEAVLRHKNKYFLSTEIPYMNRKEMLEIESHKEFANKMVIHFLSLPFR